MSHYLIAVWDYVAEGEYELSFKQGDKIKLLERHNDDWYVCHYPCMSGMKVVNPL
jgi:hypothetical protein